MRKPKRRWIILGLILALIVVLPLVLWGMLTFKPESYPAMVTLPPEERKAEAKRFVAQSLQLRNDIINEPKWEAVFTDQEVNAWLAEDLVTEFADQIPPGVHEPRVAFEPGRMILAFQLDEGPVRSNILVVAHVRVPEPNVLALTLEKIRAGLVPIPADRLLEPMTLHARRHGLEIQWEHDENEHPVAMIRYRADKSRHDIVLDRLQFLNGQIRLLGRSERQRAAASLTLPSRRVLQATFRKRKFQSPVTPSLSPVSFRDSSAIPTQ